MYDDSVTPLIDYLGNKTRVKFTGSCLKQTNILYTHGTIVNVYIVSGLGLLVLTTMILH